MRFDRLIGVGAFGVCHDLRAFIGGSLQVTSGNVRGEVGFQLGDDDAGGAVRDFELAGWALRSASGSNASSVFSPCGAGCSISRL
jgi:hypothetical protein